jgi:hypothetical protein
MKNKFDKIDETLNIESSNIDSEIISTSEILNDKLNKSIKNSDNDDDIDYQYTRGQLYNLISKGQEAIDQIMEVAQQSDSARAYEVAGQLIKNVGDVTDKLIDLQHKMKKLKEEDPKGPKNVTNALFVGSTADLQKLIKNSKLDLNS